MSPGAACSEQQRERFLAALWALGLDRLAIQALLAQHRPETLTEEARTALVRQIGRARG